MRSSRVDANTGGGVTTRVAETLLTIAAVIGGLLALGAVLSVTLNLSVLLFKTGSMSPTIPTGSAAVVREIPATEAKVGDVVTVDRPGALPVTHRIVAIEDRGADRVRLTLRGDGNRDNDPTPYTVSTVRILVFHVPGVAPAIALFSHPLAIGAISVVAAVVVGWSFWPRRSPGMPHGDSAGQERTADADLSEPAGPAQDTQGAHVTRVLCVGALLAGVIATTTGVPAARAVEDEDDYRQVYSSSVLTIISDGDRDEYAELQVGKAVTWTIGVRARAPDPGIIRFGLSGSGSLVDEGGLTVSVRSCTQEWVQGACPGSREDLVTERSLTDVLADAGQDAVRTLSTMSSEEERWVEIELTLTSSSPGASADVDFVAWGKDDALSASLSGTGLAATGASGGPYPLVLAVSSLVAGLGVASIATARRRRTFSARHRGGHS